MRSNDDRIIGMRKNITIGIKVAVNHFFQLFYVHEEATIYSKFESEICKVSLNTSQQNVTL